MDRFKSLQVDKKKAETKVVIGGAAIIVAVIMFVLLMNSQAMYVAIPIGIFGVVYAAIGGSNFSKINNKFKNDVLGNLIKEEIEDGYYNATQGLSGPAVYSSEFLKRADRYHSEDYITGKIDGVAFASSDLKLEERHVQHTKNGTRTYYETYFQGRMFIFEFNKDFAGYVQVLERGWPHSSRKYSKIKLESVAFNKKFKTYTTNDHTAFYVLTPHLMEALMEFEKNNRGAISFSFIDDKLYIGINNMRDTFELQMFRPIDERLLEEFKRDLNVVKDVVHELRLNNNIFK